MTLSVNAISVTPAAQVAYRSKAPQCSKPHRRMVKAKVETQIEDTNKAGKNERNFHYVADRKTCRARRSHS